MEQTWHSQPKQIHTHMHTQHFPVITFSLCREQGERILMEVSVQLSEVLPMVTNEIKTKKEQD